MYLKYIQYNDFHDFNDFHGACGSRQILHPLFGLPMILCKISVFFKIYTQICQIYTQIFCPWSRKLPLPPPFPPPPPVFSIIVF